MKSRIWVMLFEVILATAHMEIAYTLPKNTLPKNTLSKQNQCHEDKNNQKYSKKSVDFSNFLSSMLNLRG